MLANTNPYQSYRQIQIGTANPLELVIKLYDGAIRFINQAKRGLETKNIPLTDESFRKAQDIIDELNVTLNMDAGEIAVNLRELYVFIRRMLVEANVKKDGKNLDDVIRILITLRSGWSELSLSQKKIASNG
jgi:flagellar protein FliS